MGDESRCHCAYPVHRTALTGGRVWATVGQITVRWVILVPAGTVAPLTRRISHSLVLVRSSHQSGTRGPPSHTVLTGCGQFTTQAVPISEWEGNGGVAWMLHPKLPKQVLDAGSPRIV
jgi:hypothetical protein